MSIIKKYKLVALLLHYNKQDCSIQRSYIKGYKAQYFESVLLEEPNVASLTTGSFVVF